MAITTPEECSAISVAMRRLLDASCAVCNASFDELAPAINELRAAGEALENLVDDTCAAHGLFPPWRTGDNVVIFDAIWRERHRRNEAALAATEQPGAEAAK
jgi:hypothetical protein